MANPILTTDSEIAHDFRPFLVVHKDGSVHRTLGTDTVPASDSGPVRSKDVEISSTTFARLYLPTAAAEAAKLPLVVYFHGGGFTIESAKSPTYHNYLNLLAAALPAVVVSVEYRLAPEHPLPAAFDDSWEAVLWSVSLSDPWLSQSADVDKLFFAGDSAGATIAHNMSVRYTKPLTGLILVHPYFNSEAPVAGDISSSFGREFGIRLWKFLCPEDEGLGLDHPWINPVKDMKAVGARKVIVTVGEKDFLRDRGVWYVEELRKSGWPGTVELKEAAGEGHVFHLSNLDSPNAKEMMDQLVRFVNN